MSALLGAKGPGVMGHLMHWARKKGEGKPEAAGFSGTVHGSSKKQRKANRRAAKRRVESSMSDEYPYE